MKTVCILLSTYNGEKYLREQLESLYHQIGCDIAIYARDDGSTDKTVNILEEYAKTHKSFHYKVGKNIGWTSSFLELLFSVPQYDYYAFCDQDDVWLPNKLEIAISVLSKTTGPAIYASKKTFVDQNLNPLNVKERDVIFDFDHSLLRCGIFGCTMVWNKKFQSLVKIYRPEVNFKGHDDYLRCLAISVPSVKCIFDNNSYILFRRHATNSSKTGNGRLATHLKRGIKNIGKRKDLISILDKILSGYSDLLDEEKKLFLQLLTHQDCIKKRILLFVSPHVKTIPSWESVILRTILLLRKIN